MRYGSVCSGIEAASVAWRHLGWQCAFVSETGRFPSAVLAARLPAYEAAADITVESDGRAPEDIALEIRKLI